MDYLLAASGALLVLLVLWEVISTTLKMSGGGPLTVPLTNLVWKLCLNGNRYASSRGFLCSCGIGLLMFTISIWVLAYWIGWTLFFSLSPESVLNVSSGMPANFIERAYYVGFTFITLGIGDFKASTPFWQMMTILLSISGFFMITLIITYLLPVVSATVEQRQLAVYLHSLDISSSTLSQDSIDDVLENNLSSLSERIIRLSQQHLAYPILHFMQSRDAYSSIPLALVELDETLTLILRGAEEDSLLKAKVLPLRKSLSIYFDTLEYLHLPRLKTAPPSQSAIVGLKPTDPVVTKQRLEDLEIRKRLMAYSGWNWEDRKKKKRFHHIKE